jgi:NTP pyrophosphatase (non-canonical NTP hydrolase)
MEMGNGDEREIGKLTITVMQMEAHDTAVGKGFYAVDRDCDFTTRALKRLALVTSEVGEAVEAIRKHDISNMGEELADIVIRCADLASFCEIDLEKEIIKKMAYNKTREKLHGKKA